jgi:hypothetical protein
MNPEVKTKACLNIENDDEALTCIKEVVAESKNQEGCNPKIVLLVQESCGGCEQEKAKWQNDIDSGVISVVDALSPEGRDIVKKNDLGVTPALLVLNCDNYMIA